MTPQEIESIYNAVWLGLDGKYDAIKYHFKSKIPANICNGLFYRLSLNDTLTKEDIVRIFVVHIILTNEFKKTARITDQEILEYKQRLSHPNLYFSHEIKDLGINNLKKLINETEFGAPLIQMLLAQKIHTITFLQICAVTRAHEKWTWGGWKPVAKRLSKAVEFLQLSTDEKIKIANLFT